MSLVEGAIKRVREGVLEVGMPPWLPWHDWVDLALDNSDESGIYRVDARSADLLAGRRRTGDGYRLCVSYETFHYGEGMYLLERVSKALWPIGAAIELER